MKIQNIPANISGFERFLIIVLSSTGCFMAHLLFTCLCYIEIKDVTALVWSCVCMFAGRLKYEHEKCFPNINTAQGDKAIKLDNPIYGTNVSPAGVWFTEFLHCLWHYVTEKHDSA